VQPTDLKEISSKVNISCFSQHIDGIDYGANTGHVLPEAVLSSGAKGSLLNHSEDLYDFEALKKASLRMKSLGLIRVICANTPEKAEKIASLSPEFIAIEPPELIGTLVSVSKANPKIISDTIKLVKKISPDIKVLCGAGVATKEDVKKALELGAEGILIATAVVKAKDQRKAIEDFVSAF
jgi:triosephosphate isomerase (TIM)